MPRSFNFKISRDILYGNIKIPARFLDCIVDTYQFQLLDWRRQLGTVHLIYRNAHHTRFEHSLGVFELSRQLSSSIGSKEREAFFSVKWKNGFKVQREFEEEKNIPALDELDLLFAASLIHDIGNYPFCHQLERSLILGMPNHEQIGSMIVRRAFQQIEFLNDNDLRELEMLKRRDALADIINTRSKNNLLLPQHILFKNIISGPYGIDFLDYIYRDAFYCGFAIRPASDFLLDHAIILYDIENETYHYGFTHHVLHELISLAHLRLDMERKVYSNKTHRIVSEMLARAIHEAIIDARLNINELCMFTDDGLLRDLERREAPKESKRLIKLIRSRRLYDVVYRFDANRPGVNPTVRHALRIWGVQEIEKLRETIYEELADKSIDKEDVLVSFPHPEERICKEGEILVLLNSTRAHESSVVKHLGEIDPWIGHYEKEYMNLRKYLVLLSKEIFIRTKDKVEKILQNNFEDWVLDIHGIKKVTTETLENKLRSLTHIQRNIISLLLDQDLTAKELGDKLQGKSRSTMIYHLDKLYTKGLVKKEKRGRKVIFIVPAEYVSQIEQSFKTVTA